MESFELINPAVHTFTDEELISRILKGEVNLYKHIMRRYNQRLYRVCMSIMHNDGEAEDVMQNAYVKAYENLHRFEGKSKFSTWLVRILINESLLWLQNNKRKINYISKKASEIKSYATNNPAHSPIQQMMNNELKSILENSINQLPQKYRTVFVMRELENLNTAETSECLGISEINVKVRLSRAKEMLRDSLLKSEYKELYSFHFNRCDRVVERVMQKLEDNVFTSKQKINEY
jgi:RNA polymerase sigma factor (sigma-70 family)